MKYLFAATIFIGLNLLSQSVIADSAKKAKVTDIIIGTVFFVMTGMIALAFIKIAFDQKDL